MFSSSHPLNTIRMIRHRPTPGYRALRVGRRSLPGQYYLVTTLCHDHHRRFLHWSTASLVASKLEEPELWGGSRLLCWVLMPDHLHMLIELEERRSLSALIQRVKSVTARVVNHAEDRSGSLWMPGFHDHALRAEEDVADVVRYIIGNPVRAGLVETVGAYPFWNTIWVGQGDDVW
jgi:putative transposase